jgi:hypothetical protein
MQYTTAPRQQTGHLGSNQHGRVQGRALAFEYLDAQVVLGSLRQDQA